MKDALIVSALSVLPRKRGARTMGWLARRKASRLVTRLFVRAYKVDLAEADGELRDYPTLEALFTRTLRPGARPVDPDPAALVSPVDGTVAAAGTTEDGRIEVAPGRFLDLGSLLGRTLHGELDVAVLYLSPRDYHRVHVPREGQVVAWRYVPGTLWPVFPAAVRKVADLFSRNERVVVLVDTDTGPMDVVLVGAFGVGRISVVFADLLTNTGGEARDVQIGAPFDLERGAPLGTFHLGSTVIVVSPPGTWRWAEPSSAAVVVGQAIAHRVLPESSSTD